jgi:hypothetical protein
MNPSEAPLLRQLAANSIPYCDPLSRLNWSLLNKEQYWLPLKALSLHGLTEFEALPELTKIRLSQYEFINFIHAGLWLEEIFLQRASLHLSEIQNWTERVFYLHGIREEIGHSLMFLKLMEASGLHLPSHLAKGPYFANLIGRHVPHDSALFWLSVVIGEEVPDKFNRYLRAQKENEINALIRQMCALHVIDEARHITHAHGILGNKLADKSKLSKVLLQLVIKLLLKQFVRAFYLPQPCVYELAGLAPGRKWHHLARTNPARMEFIAHCVKPTLNLLKTYGIQISIPKL